VAIALFALVLARQTSLTLSIPAARIPVVLEQISKETGLALEAGRAMRNEVVCVRVTAASTETVLAKLAQVTGGEWRESGGVRRLFPSIEVEKRERQERIAKLTSGASAMLKHEREVVARVRTMNEQSMRPMVDLVRKSIEYDRTHKDDSGSKFAQELEAKSPGSPGERLMSRLLDRIPFKDWISLAPGERIVFSSNPTPMQIGFANGGDADIQRYVAEYKVWMATLGPLMSEEIEKVNREQELSNGETLPLPGNLPSRFKVNLAIELDRYSDSASASLTVRNAKGEEVDAASISLSDPDWQDGQSEEEGAPPEIKGDPLIQPSAEGLARITALNAYLKTSVDSALDDLARHWQPIINDPLANEPLTFVGRRWSEIAKLLNVNLIASIDEFQEIGEPNRPLGARAQLMSLNAGHKVVESSGWVTIQPTSFSLIQSMRVDRDKAKALFASSIRSNGLTIEDMADYAASHSAQSPLLGWDRRAIMFLLWTNGVPRPRVGGTELTIYGSLPREQRELLRHRPIPFANLPATTREMLAKKLYYIDEDLGEFSVAGVKEPTDQFPNGIPADGFLSITSEGSEDLIVPTMRVNGREYPVGPARNAAAFGRVLGGLAGTERQRQAAQTNQAYSRFRIATGRWFNLRIQYSPAIHTEYRLYEILCPPGRILSYSDLPAGYRDEVEKAKQAAIKEIQAHPPVTNPPPP